MAAVIEHVAKLRLTANVEPVANYDAGIADVLQGRSDVLFGDREKLLAAVQRNPAAKDLRVLTRRFTFALLAFATPRNDDDFRLAIDRALSEVYADPAFGALYKDNFGVPDTETVAFFRNVGVPADLPIREPR
jgi:polar amino acid transport system substrate-binding protein